VQVFVQDAAGSLLFDKYAVRNTPTVMLFNGDGEAVDWLIGYAPPVENYKGQVDQSLKGEGTVKSLKLRLAQDPNSVETLFKLGEKFGDFGDEAKAIELNKKILVLDPDGKSGSNDFSYGTSGAIEKVTYAQYAEYNIGTAAARARPADPGPLQAFIKKYPRGEIVRAAFSQLSRTFYQKTATKTETSKFYEDYTDRFPQDVSALAAWIQRILQDKEPLDKGIALAQKAMTLVKVKTTADSTPASPVDVGLSLALPLARLYDLKGEKAKALETIETVRKEVGEDSRIITSIAQAYLDIGAEDKALTAYGPAFLKKNLNAPVALRGYAAFWTNQNMNLASALEAAIKGTELAGNDYRSWTTLGNVYLKLRKPAEAINAAEKALQVAPAGFQEVANRLAGQIKSQAAAIK